MAIGGQSKMATTPPPRYSHHLPWPPPFCFCPFIVGGIVVAVVAVGTGIAGMVEGKLRAEPKKIDAFLFPGSALTLV